MDMIIQPRRLQGQVEIMPSKSQLHRLLICAAFADAQTLVLCGESGTDIEATAACLNALGARVERVERGYLVVPAADLPEKAVLPCGESGSTLRFLLPIVGALGIDGVFEMEGRLPQRPLSPLWEEMERMGCALEWVAPNQLRCRGKLHSGEFRIDGNVSSQFVSGLLLATALMQGESRISILGQLESSSYVAMTEQAMKLFRIKLDGFCVTGKQIYRTPGEVAVEGDWSNGAFWLVAQALGSDLQVCGLNTASCQPDRAILRILPGLQAGKAEVACHDIPDLVPILAVAAGALHGGVFTGIRRLRLKESDRVAATVDLICKLGGHAEATEDTLIVYPGKYRGGVVDACNDHRIAMAAAVVATVCDQPVTILGAEAVQKSYPGFWDIYQHLGGNYA